MIKRLFTIPVAVAASASLIASVVLTAARQQSENARTWSPAVPVAPITDASLQSGPSLSIAGDAIGLAFTDSRNSAPDVYANVTRAGTRASDARVSNATPTEYLRPGSQGVIAVEASGRAFVAFVDNERLKLARYDVAANSWLSNTTVSPPGQWWQSVSAPSIASNGNGGLIIAWEDFRNTTDDAVAPDVYARVCDGNTLTCGAEIKLNTDAGNAVQQRPRVAMRGTTAVIVWEDYRENGNATGRIYARVSNDGGVTWSPDARINKTAAGAVDANDPKSATRPAVAIQPDGAFVAAWQQADSATAAPDIYAAAFSGGSWSVPARVDGAPARMRASNPSVAASTAGTFVAWADQRNGTANADIYAARFSGTAWVETRVSANPKMQVLPAIAADGATVRLTWQDDRSAGQDLYVSAWNGSGWDAETLASESPARSAWQAHPSLTSSTGTYASFFDMRNGFREHWLARLEGAPGAPNWTLIAPIPNNDPNGNDLIPSPAAIDSGSSVHAAWVRWVDGEGDTIMHASYANGAWSEPRGISVGTGAVGKRDPAIAVRNGMVAVAWTYFGANNQHEIYAAWLRDGAWSAPTKVSAAPKTLWGVRPSIAIDNLNRIHVVWGDSEANGRGRIVQAYRDPAAAAWTYGRVDAPVNSDWCPQANAFARSDNAAGLYVIWTGCTLKNPPNAWPHSAHILYSQSTDSGATWSPAIRLAEADATAGASTDSQPSLGVAGPGDVMAIYPARGATGPYTFFAHPIRNGQAGTATKLTDAPTNWLDPGDYSGNYYPGDGRGAVAWDAAALRFVTLFPDRRNGRTVNLYSSTFGEQSLRKLYLPLTRR
jgi:hypothetical protein